MAEQRTIHQGVVVDGRTITDPDELAQAASADQLRYLTEQGAISGFGTAIEEKSEGEGAFGPGEGEQPGGRKGSPSPDSMTKAQLIEEAERQGVDVNESMTKAEIVAALEQGK